MTTTTVTRLVVLDKDGDDRMDYPITHMTEALEDVADYTDQLPKDAPYRLVMRTVTTTDVEVEA